MQDTILRAIIRQQSYQLLVKSIEQGQSPTALFGVASGVRPIVAAALASRFGQMIYVAHTPSQAMRVYEEVRQLISGVVYFPEKEPYIFGAQAQNRDATFERIDALWRIRSGQAQIVLCCADALLTPVLPPSLLEEGDSD